MGKDGQSAEELAKQKEEETEKAKEEMRALEEGDLPDDISGWAAGRAKYETFGMDDDAYGEGATARLGPANSSGTPTGRSRSTVSRSTIPTTTRASPSPAPSTRTGANAPTGRFRAYVQPPRRRCVCSSEGHLSRLA